MRLENTPQINRSLGEPGALQDCLLGSRLLRQEP